MKSRILRTATVLASAAVCVLLAVPASAAAPSKATFTLSKVGAEVNSLLPLPKLTTLKCDPPGGTHPDREAACAVLAKANGDFNKIEPLQGRVCTLQYMPITVRADGKWHGRDVEWEAKFPNECAANVATANLYNY
ncbi:SSI family serine proteinase inhibitor [Actinocrispum sp. NPDC049592]|uniref:SSI family serine proteinase inhibitor n=1 Tax=Actinocrispum sp. NPDC049592 TaxID=3154835 RepID=UPI0034345D0C